MFQGGFVWGWARWLFAVCLVLSGFGLQGPAWAQETDASIAQMFAKAQHAQEAEGTESDAYRAELLNILTKIQPDPSRRAETKRALRLLLDNLRIEPHIATPLQVLLALWGWSWAMPSSNRPCRSGEVFALDR